MTQDELNQIWRMISFNPGHPLHGWAANSIWGPQLSHKEHGTYEQSANGVWHRLIDGDRPTEPE